MFDDKTILTQNNIPHSTQAAEDNFSTSTWSMTISAQYCTSLYFSSQFGYFALQLFYVP